MELESLRSKLHGLLDSIDLLLSRDFHGPSLILVYSTIDILAWLDRSETHEDVTKSDFLSWVDRYLLPILNTIMSSVDMYSARCSLLHSYSPESKLSREGEARELFYSWGTGKSKDLQEIIDTTDREAVAIHIERLVDALRSRTLRFLEDVAHSVLILKRAEKLFTNVPI